MFSSFNRVKDHTPCIVRMSKPMEGRVFNGKIDGKQWADLEPAARDAAVKRLIEKCGYAAAALTILPIPGTEVLAVMPIHVAMVVEIGHAHRFEVTKDSATELILRIGATVGLSLVGSRVAMTMGKILIPGLGGLIGAPFMYASTLAIGMVARAYFASGGSLSNSDMKSVYKETVRKAKREFDPTRARDKEARDMAEEARGSATAGEEPESSPGPGPRPSPVERLQQLKDMLDAGLIEQSEYDETKARVLAEM